MRRYLPGIKLPADWRLEANLAAALSEAEYVVVAACLKSVPR